VNRRYESTIAIFDNSKGPWEFVRQETINQEMADVGDGVYRGPTEGEIYENCHDEFHLKYSPNLFPGYNFIWLDFEDVTDEEDDFSDERIEPELWEDEEEA
jgi:hypothetical protein